MSPRQIRRFPVLALLLAGLVVGFCLTTDLAEAASYNYRVCTVVTGGEVSSSQTAPLIPAVVAVGYVLFEGLQPSGIGPLDPTPDLKSNTFWQDLSSRAPPTLL